MEDSKLEKKDAHNRPHKHTQIRKKHTFSYVCVATYEI